MPELFVTENLNYPLISPHPETLSLPVVCEGNKKMFLGPGEAPSRWLTMVSSHGCQGSPFCCRARGPWSRDSGKGSPRPAQYSDGSED